MRNMRDTVVTRMNRVSIAYRFRGMYGFRAQRETPADTQCAERAGIEPLQWTARTHDVSRTAHEVPAVRDEDRVLRQDLNIRDQSSHAIRGYNKASFVNCKSM